MKPALIIAAFVVAVLNGVLIAIATVDYHMYLASAALAVSLIVVVLAFVAKSSAQSPAPAPAPVVQPPAPAPVQDEKVADRYLITLLGLLQEKGRLLDFLMEDVTAYDDAQVGAVGRVVHQGCREVLREYFKIVPVAQGSEGSSVTVPAGFAPDEYRLSGKIAGDAPFNGTLVHKGWKTESVKLPRPLSTDASRLPAIAPAEVELK